jgi:hypothetical protein
MKEATAIKVGTLGPVTAVGPVRLFRIATGVARICGANASDLLAATSRAKRVSTRAGSWSGAEIGAPHCEACAGKSALNGRYSDRCYVRVSSRIDAFWRTK